MIKPLTFWTNLRSVTFGESRKQLITFSALLNSLMNNTLCSQVIWSFYWEWHLWIIKWFILLVFIDKPSACITLEYNPPTPHLHPSPLWKLIQLHAVGEREQTLTTKSCHTARKLFFLIFLYLLFFFPSSFCLWWKDMAAIFQGLSGDRQRGFHVFL